MFRIITEIVPFGEERDKHQLRVINVVNTLKRSVKGETFYDIYIDKDPRKRDTKKDGRVKHLREDGDLILTLKVHRKIANLIKNGKIK